jgi:hypothetical protein
MKNARQASICLPGVWLQKSSEADLVRGLIMGLDSGAFCAKMGLHPFSLSLAAQAIDFSYLNP